MVTLINKVMIDNCDSLAVWVIGFAGDGVGLIGLDPTDKVEGAASIAVTQINAWGIVASKSFSGMIDFSATPFLELQMEINVGPQLTRIVLLRWNGTQYVYYHYDIPPQPLNQWNMITVDLRNATEGFADLTNISGMYLRFEPNTHTVNGAVRWDNVTRSGETTPPQQATLTVTTSAGGSTNPAPNTYLMDVGSTYQVTAIPDEGYSFGYWELDGANVGSNPTYTGTLDVDHTLLAVFAAQPPPSTHQLTVNSTPIQGVPFTIERVS